ncbi:MAG: PHP domain-containing protein [Clostridiales bacterium]|nr:PHP domain-containing protein [Clostridiales bacterium]
MRKYLISNEGTFYKANLHCHSTMSDGKLTPEEVKEHYLSLGYSVVAYTDHDLMVCHNDLTDENFVALNGFEVEFWEKDKPAKAWAFRSQCHINFIALDQDNDIQPFWHRSKYIIGNNHLRHLGKFDENEPDFERWYDEWCISRMMREGREKGFFVTYNHPCWSRENYSHYSKYKGMNALEIMNGAIQSGFEDYCPYAYDDILRGGEKIYCIAGDDNHNRHPLDSVYSESGACWTMIKAEKLTYKAITDSMLAGNFYASEGPEIYELYIEDDKLFIKTSPAYRISINYQGRKANCVMKEKDGAMVTEAVFELSKKHGYFRLTVDGPNGKHACTNAYFPEDIGLI